ncbi:MAG: tetratricopeptide repeat protein [Longimicrobiales bacterium]|nr:tetratricopeptide repeat protein [Longimicrobiales bacterium]
MTAWGVREWSRIAALLAVVVFLPSLRNGFAFDDLSIILDNEALRDPGSLGRLLVSPWWPAEDGVAMGLWRPTSSALLFLLWQIGGGAPLVFHLANVALHGAVTFLVVRFAAHFVPVAVAGLAGLVFAVHPVHVEAVANGVGIAELLAALLLLAALEPVLRADRLTARETLTVMALYLLAFGAKESAVVLPGLIFVVDAVRRRLTLRDAGSWLVDRGPLLAGLAGVAAVMLGARLRILGSLVSALPPLGAGILAEIPGIWTLGEIWSRVVVLVTLPLRLSPDYAPGVIPIVTVWTPRAAAGAATVVGLLLLTLVVARRLRPGEEGPARDRPGVPTVALALGVSWFVVAIAPTSNALFLTGVLLAERTLYLPSVGVAIAIAGLLGPLLRAPSSRAAPGRPRRLRLVAGGALLLLGTLWVARSVTYIPAWRSQATIFQYMIETVPESGRSQWVMGDVLLGEGEVERAMFHYRRALGLLGSEYPFLAETGRRLIAAGRADAARPFLDRAFAADPERAAAPSLLAVVFAQDGDWEGVERWAARAIERDPGDATAHHLRAVALAAQERWSEAVRAREDALAFAPGAWQQWFWLADVRARAGDREAARAAVDSARARASAPSALHQIDSLGVALGIRGAGPDAGPDGGRDGG